MNSQSPKNGVLLAVGLALLVALSMVPLARAQNYGPWSAPVNLNAIVLSDGTVCPGVVNSAFNDSHPAISKDGLTLFFASTRPGGSGGYDLWFSKRESLDGCWQPPVNLGPVVNSPSLDFAPNLSNDGHWLFFHSNRPGGCGGLDDLYASHRVDTSNDLGWENPVNLGCALNTKLDQGAPDFFDDGRGTLFLYIVHNLTPANPDGGHIYFSTCPADSIIPGDITADAADSCNFNKGWSSPAPVPELSSSVRDTTTAIRRRDGLEMIITSGRCNSPIPTNDLPLCSTPSAGGLDLWVSTRDSVQLSQDNWRTPVNLNQDNLNKCSQLGIDPCPVVNTSANDAAPALSWDGTELYFFSDRPDLDVAGDRDLYRSTRTIKTTTALSSSTNPAVFGQSVTFTATVEAATGDTPTGTVTFSDGPTPLGTVTLPSGHATATFSMSSLSIGSHPITAQYHLGRTFGDSEGSLTQNIEYGICPLYDQTRSINSGATFPIKLQLCDVNGNDLSSSAIVVHATSVNAVSGFSGAPDAPGNANPDNDFRFDPTLGSSGGYIFNLSTAGLPSGTYSLQFIAGSDPATHSVNFGVK